MTGPYDQAPERPTLEKTSVDSGLVSSTSEEKPRFQLSREMKILLGVLALGAAVAGWYVVSGVGTPTDTATTPSTTIPSTAPATTGTGTGSTGVTTSSGTAPATTVVPGVTAGSGTASGPATPATSTSSVTSTAGSAVDVPQVPFLNPQSGQATSGQTQGTTDGGDIAATAPVGINPADPLAAVPSSNPFQPLTVVNPAGTATSAAGTPSASTAPSAGTTATSGQSSASGQNSGLQVAGAVPLPSVPVSGLSSGGATLSGSGLASSGQSSTDSVSSGLSSGGAIPLPSVPVGGLTGSTGTAATTGNGATVTGTPSTDTTGSTTGSSSAVILPAAGTITPSLQTPTLGTLALSGTGNTPTGTAAAGTASTANGTGTTGTSTAFNTTLPSAGLGDTQPGLISQYGSANATAAAVVSALDQLVQSRNLVFNAVVLGPINTAIFKTDKGFVVVPTGQTLPDSTVVLKEVTSTSATLSLGNDSKILELDKR